MLLGILLVYLNFPYYVHLKSAFSGFFHGIKKNKMVLAMPENAARKWEASLPDYDTVQAPDGPSGGFFTETIQRQPASWLRGSLW